MREWYFQAMGQELGPFSAAELKIKVDTGQIQRDTLVRRGADGKWLFAERVKGLLPVVDVPQPPPIKPAAKPKSSATMPIVESLPVRGHGEPPKPPSSYHIPVISIPLDGNEDSDEAAAPSAEFYDFVGFREAISPVLHQAVRKYISEHRLTMTQMNRRALAAFISRPELASDLMITNMAVIPQAVNEKSSSNGRDPLPERDRAEHATFRITLFNCSNSPLEVTDGEFHTDSVDVRHYDEVGTKAIPGLDHKGHLTVKVDNPEPGTVMPVTVNAVVAPLAATNVVVWFRGSNKPSLTRIRGQLRFGADKEVALSDAFTVIMHGDSP